MSKKSEPIFRRGDIVVSKSGHRPMTCECDVDPGTHRFYARYLHNKQMRYVWTNSMKLYDEKPEEVKMENTLYSVLLENGSTTFATKVGINSANKFLMEEKGTGAILVVDPSAVEEIVPHTIAISPIDTDRYGVNYMIEPGKLLAGDLVLHAPKGSKTFSLGIVRKVDTKCKSAKEFRGVKISTELIG